MMLSDVCLSESVAYIRSGGGVCGRPAGWRLLADRARLGRPGSKLPLRDSVAGLGGGISWRPPAYSLFTKKSKNDLVLTSGDLYLGPRSIKIYSIGTWIMLNHSVKFCKDLISGFWVILFTDRPTDRHGWKYNLLAFRWSIACCQDIAIDECWTSRIIHLWIKCTSVNVLVDASSTVKCPALMSCLPGTEFAARGGISVPTVFVSSPRQRRCTGETPTGGKYCSANDYCVFCLTVHSSSQRRTTTTWRRRTGLAK